MGFFDKLFRQEDHAKQPDKAQPGQTQREQESVAFKTEQELIEQFGGIGFDKQLSFAEVIGDQSWNADMSKAEIVFGTDLRFPIQVLGTFSYASETWLWAWANTASGLPENSIQQALQLQKYGEENEINLFRNSDFDASKHDLHLIGLIASGMFNSSAYYIADYGQGAMLVTIKSKEAEETYTDNHHKILTVFPQLISQFEMNHHLALLNYLNAKGYDIADEKMSLTATKNGNTLTAAFDELSRLTELKG